MHVINIVNAINIIENNLTEEEKEQLYNLTDELYENILNRAISSISYSECLFPI